MELNVISGHCFKMALLKNIQALSKVLMEAKGFDRVVSNVGTVSVCVLLFF